MNQHINRLARAAALLAAAAVLAACGSTTPRMDSSFGGTVRATLASQVVRPEAVRNTDPAAGVDGAVARASYERYLRDAANPPAPAEAMTASGNLK